MQLKPVYYFYGQEDYVIETEVRAIKEDALAGGFRDLNYQSFDADATDAPEIISACMTMPAFSNLRVVLVKNAQSLNAKDEEALTPYLRGPSPSTCLILVSTEHKVDLKKAFFKLLDEKKYLRQCKSLTDGELRAWIKKEVKSNGKTISDAAAQKLIALAGGKLRDVKGELEKVVLYCGEKPAIDDAMVDEAVNDIRDETMFDLADAIGARDVRKALRLYGKLSNVNVVKAIGPLAWHIRVLLKLRSLQRAGVSKDRLPYMAGVQPWRLDQYLRSASRFSEEELKGIIKKFYLADRDFKSGRIPQSAVMSKLIMELCAQR